MAKHSQQADGSERQQTADSVPPDADTEAPPTDKENTTADTAPPQQHQIQHRRQTERWTGLVGIALAIGGVGLLASIPALLLASAACVGVLGFVAASQQPTPQLRVTRRFDRDPDPGDEVEVQVIVENTGSGTLPDLRLIDLVPSTLGVVDGSPRRAVTLRPGDTVTLQYTVVARRGVQTFEGTIGIVRGLAGTVETKYRIDATDQFAVAPRFEPLENATVRSLTTPYAGRVRTDEAGEGIEFHTLREYRLGDPVRRVDWNRRARGEPLATVQFQTERTASIVLVADRRATAFVRPGQDEQSAADRGLDALCRLFPTLLDQGHLVGIATLGPTFRLLSPATGSAHRARARELLATDPVFAPTAPEQQLSAGLSLHRLRTSLSGSDQVIVCTPLCDDDLARAVRTLHANGHSTTVISPDPTVPRTAGQRLARVERTLRIARLRRAGVRVVDWAHEEPIDTALAQAAQRWSA